MFITCGTVTSIENARVRFHIGRQVAIVVLPDRACNRRPWVSHGEHSLHIIALQYLQTVKTAREKKFEQCTLPFPFVGQE